MNGIREFGWVMVLSGLGLAHAADPAPVPPPAATSVKIEVPDWLFPIDPKSIKPNPNPPKLDDKELLEIPDSREKFTLARINDPFNAPDWRPNDHIVMPEILAHGRKPAVMACAYCHTPTGQGRPENSALAGLPANRIVRSIAAS